MKIISDSQKQMIRLQKVAIRQRQKSYKNLTAEQKKYVQAWNSFNHVNKELNRFWCDAPRNLDGAVDWKKVTDPEMENFEQLKSRSKRYFGIMSRLEESGFDKDKALAIFQQTNCHSESY